MAEQDICKIKQERDEFLAKLKELIDTLQGIIIQGKIQMASPSVTVGSFVYYKFKLEVLDAEGRLKTRMASYQSHLWSWNDVIIPEYKKQVEDCEQNFDSVHQKAKAIVDSNDMKAKNFELIKKVFDGYDNPKNEMGFKILFFNALKSLL